MRCAGLLLLLGVASTLVGCAAEQGASRGEQVIRVGLAQMPTTLDPRYATDAASVRVQQFLHRGLIRLNERFLPEGDLAESWAHPDPLRWRFRLREDIRFHDGSRVRADDVIATLRSVLDERRASPLRAGLSAIAAMQAPDDRTLEIRLHRPDASFLTRLNIGILPSSVAALPQQARMTAGCGDYRLAAWRDGRMTIEAVAGDSPAIRFIGVRDPVTRVLKLARGEIDFTQNDLPPHLLAWLRKQPGLTIRTRPSTTFDYLGLNLQDARLKDVRVRRALALALDRRALKKALFADLPTLAETVLVPDHWAAAPLPETPYDPARAERLLDEAGWTRGPNGTRFTLTYRTSTDPVRLRLATAIAAMWSRIGVRTRIESLEWGGFYARIKRGDFQVYSLAWVGITDPDIYRWILHSTMWPPKGANRGRYADPEMDAWLDAAVRSEGRRDGRRLLYERIERKMHRDMVYIPLWHEPVVAVSGERLIGFEPAPDGSLLGLRKARLR
ncbi:MAG: ABC transporter substrate-binding protein [Mariprofundaceae bacterium]